MSPSPRLRRGPRLARLLRPSGRDERGMTLVEISAVLLILSLIMLPIIQGFTSFQTDSHSNEVRLQNLDEARVLMATVTKDLRTATRLTSGTSAFLIAGDREVQFYANIDTTTAPKLVHIYVDNTSELIEVEVNADVPLTPPNYTYTGAGVVRFVGRFVANPVGTPLFTFYDKNGTQLTTTPLNAADRLAVVSVGITFQIRKVNAENVPYTTLVNQVYLPNLDFNPIPT